jgi:G6PDH family F420-dependent oxidoreductase
VTCPTFRYHPAIVAQAAATVAILSDGRFHLGLGSGERLNEHVVGLGWPSVELRHEVLEEAVDMIRLLFEGETCSYGGEHLQLESARLFDLPDAPPEILIAAGGREAAELAARKGDGLMAAETSAELVAAYRKAGGEGSRYVEIGMCWAESEAAALRTMHRYARWSGLGWEVLPELATPKAFAAATKSVRPEDLAEDTPHGPDPAKFVDAISKAVDAGFDHLVLHQIGPEQAGFLRFFEQELRPAVAKRSRRGGDHLRATT